MSSYITDIAHIDELRTQFQDLQTRFIKLHTILTEKGWTNEEINSLMHDFVPPTDHLPPGS